MANRLSTKLDETLQFASGKYGVAAAVLDDIIAAGSSAGAAATAASAAQSTATSASGTAAAAATLATFAASTATSAASTAGAAQTAATSAASAASAAASAASAAQTTANAAVPKALFDANTILIATTDNTPIPLVIPASTIVGRKASGDIVALTAADVLAFVTSIGSKPLYVPPSVPEAIDEEFDSLTLPTFTWRDTVNGADRTPSQNSVDLFTTLTGAAAVPRVNVHTQWRGSWMIWQVTDSNTSGFQYTTKPIGTVPTDAVYWTRMRLGWKDAAAGNPNRLQFVIAADNGAGKVDVTNQICFGLTNGGGSPKISAQLYIASAVVTANEDAADAWSFNSQPIEYFAMQKIGTSYYLHVSNDGGGGRCFGQGFAVTFTPAHIGWRCLPGASGGQFPIATFGADFLRRLTGRKLPW